MSDNKLWNIELRIPGEPEFLGVVRLASAGISHRLGLDHELAEDLKLVATEACGHLLNLGAEEIMLSWQVEREQLSLRVWSADGYDENNVDEEADQEWKEIGLLLITSLMDEVEELTSPLGLRLVKRTTIEHV